MTGCLNGGSCLLDTKKESFSCSCKLPWSGQRCEEKLSKPLVQSVCTYLFFYLCIRLFIFFVFHERKVLMSLLQAF